jgi:group I intron endonuclease
MIKMKCGIYKIVNIINNKIYIGQSSKLNVRKVEHFYKLRKGIHRNPHLQNAFNKYGEENFIFEVILYCELDELDYYEQNLVDLWKPEYNIKKKCVNSMLGTKLSEQTKEKMSKSKMGHLTSEETKRKISESNIGKIMSEEAKNKMSLSKMGTITSEETKKKLSDASMGVKKSEEHKKHISESKMGEKNPMHGKPRSEELKLRQSFLMKKYWESKRNIT